MYKTYRYFEYHKVTAPIQQPPKVVFQKMDASQRILKWAVKLSPFMIQFEVQQVIKKA